MWVLCINLDGPFNSKRLKCNDFAKPPHLSSSTKRIKHDSNKASGIKSNSKSRKKRMVMSPSGKRLDNTQQTAPLTPPAFQPSLPTPTPANVRRSLPKDKPPSWAIPGLHMESVGDIAWLKSIIMEQHLLFTSFLSPYFSRHLSVMRGFWALFKLFAWTEVEVITGDSELQLVNTPPTQPTTSAKLQLS